MRAPVTVIIPCLNSAHQIVPLAGQLYDGVSAGVISRLILADGGSHDDTRDLAHELGAKFIQTAPGRGVQLAAACAQMHSDWLLILHADSCLPDGWIDAVKKALRDPGFAHYFDLRFDAQGIAPRWTAGWANLRSRIFGLPYGDQGLLIHHRLYRQVGGYPDMPLMEDVALARRLRGHLHPLGAALTTSAAAYLRHGWLRRGAANLWRLIRFLLGADPVKLVRKY